jgi:hypothetical protein
MENIYSECNVTWASIEKYIPYSKVVWSKCKNGIPVYTFFDENYKKIDINNESFLFNE